MALFARELQLDSFRNFKQFTVALSTELTILVGHNAVGKTNCIEALQLLTSGTSFKNPSVTELLLQNEHWGRAYLLIEGDKRKIETELELKDEKKTFKLNGKNAQAKSIRGILPSILFYPDDLQLIKGSPHYRRDEIDNFGSQLNDNYQPLKNKFEKTLTQRNKLLKDEFVDEVLLDAWTESFIAHSALLYLYRTSLFDRLVPKIIENYQQLAPHEELAITYLPSFGVRSEDETREEVVERLTSAFAELKEEEKVRRMTLIGPQRDDIQFLINGKDARLYGSQGQQRSLVLSTKIAEVELVQEILGYYPLLLLDDVMSELDELRREAMLQFINSGVQTVITTTNLAYFTDEVLQRAKVVRIDGK